MLRRTPGWVGLAVCMSAVLLCSMPMSASAGWSKESVTGGWLLWYPAVAVEADDDLDVVYARLGSDPGLFFATNTAGSWSSTRMTSNDAWAPDIVLDGAGHVHVVYASSGTDAGIHYVNNVSGSWTDTQIATDPEVDRPSIALDGSGNVHIVYTVHGVDPGLYHASNEAGGWARTRVIAAAQDWSPDIAIDPSGTLHVVAARFDPGAPGLYYLRRTSGTWSAASRLTTTYDDWPSIAVNSAGKVYMAFQRFGSQTAASQRGSLFTASNSSGSWAFERMFGLLTSFRIGPPDAKLDGAGTFHVVVREFAKSPTTISNVIWHYAGTLGQWDIRELPLYAPYARDDEPTVALLSDGVRAVYASNEGNPAGIFVSGMSGDVVSTASLIATSRDDQDPTVVSAADGTRHLTFDRVNSASAERGVHYGDDAGGWSFERTQIGPNPSDVPGGDTDLGLVGDGSARIVTSGLGVTHLTNQNGTWEGEALCCSPSEAALAVDGGGVSHVAMATDGKLVKYLTNATGSWATTELWRPLYDEDTLAHPAIVVDGSGLRTVFFAYVTPRFTPGVFFLSAPSGSAWPKPTRLASGDVGGIQAAADSGNKLHVAWLDIGANPGVYYATNKTGTWSSPD